MPRKENTKAKTWERDRRKRMNGYFKNLSDLLPPQLEGRKRNKIDILIHASKYIKDLHNRTDELFHARASDAHKEELARLKRLVTQLLSRTQLLSDLLKNAGITVPAEPALEKISPLKWSNKINVVSGSKLINKIETNKRGEKKKERNSNNLKINIKKKSVKLKKAEKQPIQIKKCPEKPKCIIEDQENHVSNDSSKKNEDNNKSSSSSSEELTVRSITEITPPKQDIKNHKKVKRKKKTDQKNSTLKVTTDINNLPTGTLVFSGGKIVPVVTPMQSLTSNIIVNAQSRPSNPIILNNTQQGQMIVVQPLQTNFQTVSTVQTMTLNAMSNIQTNMLINPRDWAQNVKTIINSSKIGGMKGILPKIREVTETTMTYKVPIPAIHKEKSDSKNENKGISINEKPNKIKNISKALKGSQPSTTEVQSDSKNFKENIKNDSIPKTKLSVNKQSLKRNSNFTLDEKKKKKVKLNEKQSEIKNVQIKAKIPLDNTVTCKSIQNLKQVIEKIGEDTSYAKVQLSNPVTSNLNSISEKQENDSNTSLIIDVHHKEQASLVNEIPVNDDPPNNSDISKVITEKDISNMSNVAEKLQVNFSEKICNEIKENNSEKCTSASPELTTELQTDKNPPIIQKTDIQSSTIDCNIDESIILSNEANQNCNLDNILQTNSQDEIAEEQISSENNKIFLNLDTNTTTTMKLEGSENKIDSISTSSSVAIATEEESIKLKNSIKDDQHIKTISYSPSNSFVPISHKTDSLHSDLSNDIFASLQVPSSSNNSESISPTAAFLMAFPIVSSLSGKTEVLDDEMKDDFKYSSQTPPMLLQIGAIEPNNFKINSRTSVNETIENTEASGLNEASQMKSTTESIISSSSSSSITTSTKSLPRVISSQTLTESFKIIPVSSEQVNRQHNIETTNSLQVQTNSTNETENPNVVSVNEEQPSIITNNIEQVINNNVENYTLESKSQSNFNYTKDIPLTSISSSMANDILNKYISTTSLSTNTIVTETSSKYNSTSHYIAQDCQSSLSNCAKENTDRSNGQYNFTCQPTNNISTDREFCKLQICPIEGFSERSNKYPIRNKEISFSNAPGQTTNSETLNKNVQVPMNQENRSKIIIHNNQNIPSNNTFSSIKKIENKEQPLNNSEASNVFDKKTNEISNSSSYINTCDSKVNKKTITASSQSNNTVQKIVNSTRSNSYSQQSEGYIVTTNYEDNSIVKSTTTVANNTSNFSILSWTTFSPLSSNNNNFTQYEASASTETSKNICENFNYLSVPKESASLPNTLTQPSYSTIDTQVHNFDKSKTKLSVDMQKRSYNDLNKSRNMRTQTISAQKSTRSHNQTSVSNSDFKFSMDNKNKYKYSMDVDYVQNSYSNGLDLAPQQQHHQQQNQQNHQNHQTSNSKNSSAQSLQSVKPDKTNYILPDYDSHINFNSGSSNIQPRYPNNHDTYTSTNFKYGEKNQQIHSKYQSVSQVPTSTLHQANSLYNNKHVQQHQSQSSQNKTKTDSNNHIQSTQQQQQIHQQHTMRPPVNWMMTPEIKHNSNIADIILPPIGKELEFCQNNIFSQTSSYNQTSTNHQFYNNYDMTHTFPNIPVLQGETKRNMETTYYPEEQAFSWSPTKNLSQAAEQNQSLKGIESSTMPTLVGDLSLGTNISDKQNFLFGQMPIRSNNNDLNKDSLKDKETSLTNRDYQGIINSQSAQHHSSHGMPFLSVSQLVDHEKVEKNQHQHQHQQPHNTSNNHHHASHHQHQQPQQQQQQPSRKQRKSNNSPRASGKRQMEMRQKHSSNNNNDHIHRQHEESKTGSNAPGYTDTNYQQQQQQQQQQHAQKYNQQNNDVQWRSRNCKSNYTAEALIGTNNNHADNSHSEKNLSKFSTNYNQNKFSSTLSSDPMSINYFPNVEDSGTGYGQVMNQNFNHSYAYSSNANIYPTTNFITNISNNSTNYMMSLHENTTDYLESNNFLLPPNVSTTSITTPLLSSMTDGAKSHHHSHPHHHHQPYVPSKHQNCDKRLYFSQQKKSKRKVESGNSASSNNSAVVQNFDFPISGITSPLDDYHHASTFLPPPNPLYQNQTNVYPKSALPPPPPPPPPVSAAAASASSSTLPSAAASNSVAGGQGIASSSNPMAMTQHHPSGTSLTNFNLSTIFPEINDKVTGYKSSANGIASGITQPTSHTSTSYSQRTSYTDPLGQMSQASESATHFNNAGSR